MARKGFTLVEILIVVIILGILAAIVIPQFTTASNDARASALSSDLQTVRSQIELYKVQHLEQKPTAAIVNELTLATKADGTVDVTGKFGPYLQKFPTNPYVAVGGNTVEVKADATGLGGGNAGWYYDSSSGKFSPDDDAHKTL